MKNKTVIYCALLTLAAVMMGTSFALSQTVGGAEAWVARVTLQMQTDKKSYLPGEVVTLVFKLSNTSEETISVPRAVSVEQRYIRVFVADESREYREYIGPGWGNAEIMGNGLVEIAPGGSIEYTATILYNHRVETSHLSELAAAQASKGRLTTTYALPQPGTYFIKAAVYDINFENKVESKPVKVKIEEPEGADREIWNKIKDDGNYALFLQTGSLVEKPTGPKTINIEASLKEIEEQHPTSRYAVGIRSAVSKRNMILEKVKNSRRTSRN